MGQNNKFLVIVMGIPRGGQTVFKSIYKYLVKPLHADLAICSEEKYIINNSLSAHAKYLWTIEDDINWEFMDELDEIPNLRTLTNIFNSYN